jgi:hypothetical protein
MAAYEQHISTVSVFPNSTNTLTPLKLTEGESLHKEVRRLTAENAKLKNYLESSASKVISNLFCSTWFLFLKIKMKY